MDRKGRFAAIQGFNEDTKYPNECSKIREGLRTMYFSPERAVENRVPESPLPDEATMAGSA